MKNKKLEISNIQEIKEMINANTLTLEALDTSALNELLDFETDLLCCGEGDMDLITRCSDLLDKRKGSPILTKDEVSAIIEKAESERRRALTETEEKAKVRPLGRKRRIIKRVAIIAASAALITALGILGTSTFDYEDDRVSFFKKLTKMPAGSVIETSDATYYELGDEKFYDSIEEAIEEENIVAMYPTEFPEDLAVTEVRKRTDEKGVEFITMSTGSPYVSFSIQLDVDTSNRNNEYPGEDTYEHNGITFLIREFKTEEDVQPVYFGTCFYKGNAYSISGRSREEVIEIIDSLKE